MTARILTLLPALLLFAGASRGDDTKDFLAPENWEGLKQYWTVEGTSITGDAKADPKFNTFLVSKKEYTDFELSFKVKLVGGKGNSGVQVRSKVVDEKKFVVAGPQCDMGEQYWGSLYGEKVGGMMQACGANFAKDNVKPEGVNEYLLRVDGDRFTIKVNGATSVEGEFPTTKDKKPTAKAGVIAFQLHQGGPMRVEFTEIKFVDLAKK